MMTIGDILTVDLSRESVERTPFPAELAQRFLAGRGINAYWLCREDETGADDPSSDSVLVMSCGLLTGTHIPASARLHISARSPLTGGLGSSNVGGGFGVRLRAAGIQTIVIRNEASRPLWLFIGPDRAELRDASALWGLDTQEAPKMLARVVKTVSDMPASWWDTDMPPEGPEWVR